MTSIYLLGFTLALISGLIVTPLVIKFARVIGAIDQPDERKVHKKPTPRLGGLAVASAFIISISILYFWDASIAASFVEHQQMVIAIAASFTIILVLGVIDDIRPLSAGIKFLVQTLAAIIVVAFGLQISVTTDPLTGSAIQLGWVAYPLSVLWILAITNAINLIDGLDGLATGISIIASIAIAVVSMLYFHYTVALVMFVVTGALLGFLKYNFNPAKIFLGDSGSLTLGFSLAIAAMQASVKSPAIFTLIVAVAILALPILDTTASILRRAIKPWLPGKHSESTVPVKQRLKSIFLPDKAHIHHQLLARGWSQRKTVLYLYLISSIFGLCAVLISASTSFNLTFLLITFFVLFAGAIIHKMKYREIAIFSNGLLLEHFITPIVKRRYLQHTIDVAGFALAAVIAWVIIVPEIQIYVAVALVVSQVIAFKILRYPYTETYKNFGIGEAIAVCKSLSVAAITGWILLVIITGTIALYQAGLFMISFYISATILLGSRLGFDMLNYLFQKNRSSEKQVLIYGTDDAGMIALHRLLNQPSRSTKPIGFLIDNPEQEGTYLNGYPVFGGHLRLERLLKTTDIHEILIADVDIMSESLKKIEAIAQKNNIPVRILRWHLEGIPIGKNTDINQDIKRPVVTSL